MKKVFKILGVLLVFLFALGVIAFIAFSVDGYDMYQKALEEKSMEDRISEIRSQERLCYNR